MSSRSVSWARSRNRPSASASSIVAEMREMTSAPKGCWLLRIERTAFGWPVSRSRSVATTVVVPRSNAIAWRRRDVSPGSTSVSTSSTRTAVTFQSASRSVRPSPRTTSMGTRGSTSSIAPSTRSRSDVWSSSVGSVSSRYRFCTAGRRITCRPTPASAAFGRVWSGGTSIVRSSCAVARQASRQPFFRSSTENARGSTEVTGRSPATTRTRHFLHVPCPPHVESIATPFQLAASKTVVPASTRASLTAWSSPTCRKRTRTRSGCGASGRSCNALTASAPMPAEPAPPLFVSLRRAYGSCGGRLLRAVTADPGGAPLVAAEQEVGRANRLDRLVPACIHDRARQSVALRDGEERGAERVPTREPERRVRRAAHRVDAQLIAQQVQRLHEERDGARLRADRHRERVDHDILGRDPVIPRRGDDLLRHFQPPLRFHRDLVVVRQPNHRCAVARDDRQDGFEPLVLAGEGVDERLPVVCRQPRLERLDHGGVDAERQLAQPLHERDRARHQPDLVRERIADVHVQDVRAACNLLRHVDLELREVPGLQLRLEAFATGRVDPLADDAERLLRTDRDRPRPGLDDGIHSSPFLRVLECRAAHTGGRCLPRGGS